MIRMEMTDHKIFLDLESFNLEIKKMTAVIMIKTPINIPIVSLYFQKGTKNK